MSDFLENFTTTPAIKIFLFVLASAAIAAFALAFIIIFIGLGDLVIHHYNLGGKT